MILIINIIPTADPAAILVDKAVTGLFLLEIKIG
jgi:hypothetical protein